MSPMLSYLNGAFLATWKLAPHSEDEAGQRVMAAQSTDGEIWAPHEGGLVLFPSMNSTESPNVALFAEPSLYINGRVYAAASPKQECLYPDQYQALLLLRQVYSDAVGHFGPLFWASRTVPPGFAVASAANNVSVVTSMDAATQADIATLTPHAMDLPCATADTSKCEACRNGCQNWSIPLNISGLENERTHWRVPGSDADVLLTRSHARVLYASVRDTVGGDWSVPTATNITDDVANFNGGNMPDGSVYLVSNAMINVLRDPLYVSRSSDGWAFTATAAVGSCEQTEIFANPADNQPWGCQYRVEGGSKEGERKRGWEGTCSSVELCVDDSRTSHVCLSFHLRRGPSVPPGGGGNGGRPGGHVGHYFPK